MSALKQKTLERNGTPLADRPVLFLKVIAGPDAGSSGRFDQASVSIGRAWGNDFKLRDLTVSGHHGVFVRTDEGFMFQDVGSRHGSHLKHTGNDTEELCTSEPKLVSDHGILQLGTSALQFEIQQLYGSTTEGGASQLKFDLEEIECRATMQIPAGAFDASMTYSETRMDALFQLGQRLNGLSELNEILSLIAEAAFDALPQANLLAINQVVDDEAKPLLVKCRHEQQKQKPNLMLSPDVLSQVLENREAVLFTAEAPARAASERPPIQLGAMCAPLLGQKSLLGVITVNGSEGQIPFEEKDLSWFSVLASSAAFALERASLNQAIYRMFEGFVQASVGAIEARDPTTAGHSQRVAKYSLALTQMVNKSQNERFKNVNFSPAELTEMRYAALLHDFGKVCVREEVLMKSARLSDAEMDKICHRFQLLRSEYRRKLAEKKLSDAIKTGIVPTPSIWNALQADVAQFSDQLTKAYRTIQELRAKWRLDPEEIKHFKDFGKQHLETLEGKPLHFLTADEIENMTIPIGTLNQREWEEMRAHVVESESFLSKIPWSEDLRAIPDIAGAHHEKLDGSGYPKGLQAAAISLQARILTIADIYDACTAWDRPYCQPISLDETVALLRKEARENKLDLDLVQLFVADVLPKIKHMAPRK